MSEFENKPHDLDIEIKEEKKERLTQKAKNILKLAEDESGKRDKWIKARQDQKQKIDDIRQQVYKAYDDGDQERLDALSNALKDVMRETSRPISKRCETDIYHEWHD